VDDATVCWRHGLQGYAPVRLGDAFSYLGSHFSQGSLSSLAIVLNIEHNPDAVKLLSDNQINQEL
jgi:hypothetical protein